jgi:glycosyltransferase involved in cell wall biosynthesis
MPVHPSNVLMFCLEYSSNVGGGVGTHVREISMGLAESGDTVTVLSGTVGNPHTQVEPNRRVYLVPPEQNQRPDRTIVEGILDYNRTLSRSAADLISSEQIAPDLIHCHNWVTYPAAKAISDQFGIPIVVTVHYVSEPVESWWGQTPDPEITVQEQQLFRSSHAFIAVSRSIRSLMREYYSVPEERVTVVYNAVEGKHFGSSSLSRTDRERLRRVLAPSGEKIVVFTGRIHPMKGIVSLLESAALVLQEEPHVRYVMAGEPDSKAFAREFRDVLGRNPTLKDRVILLGKLPRQQVALLYSVANMALMPSVYDPCPYAAIEAMAAGVPLIASDGGGLAELVDNRITGLSVPVRVQPSGLRSVEPQELANATLSLLRNEEMAQELAKAALQKAAEAYSLPAMVSATQAVYREVLCRHSTMCQ